MVVDLETTGLANDDEIIEIGAIKFENNIEVARFSELVKSKKKLSPKIIAITHIVPQMLEKARTINEVSKDFFDFLGDCYIVGHNVSFDLRFLRKVKFELFDSELLNQSVDTKNLGRKLLGFIPKLKDLAQIYDISYEGAHRAVVDCEITAKCYDCLRIELLTNEKIEGDFLQKRKLKVNKEVIRKESNNFVPNSLFVELMNKSLSSKKCFEDKNFVFTGEFFNFSRHEVTKLVENYGGVVKSCVSKKVNFVVLGEKEDGKKIGSCLLSTKYIKAEELIAQGCSIKILKEDEFIDLLKNI